MTRNLAQKTYDVFVADGDRWLLDSQHDVRSEAELRAEQLVSEAKVSGVRIVAENHRTGDEEVIFEEQIDLSEKPLQIVPIEDAPLCDAYGDHFSLEARRALGRLLRQYLDLEGKTALELMFDYGALRLLERKDTLFGPALQRIGTIQAKATGEKPLERTEKLGATFERIKSGAQEAETDTTRLKTLEAEGVAGVFKRAPKKPMEKRIFVLSALAALTRKQGDWSSKLEALIGLAEKAQDEEALSYVDEVMAELIDGNEAVTEIFGGFGDSISAFQALVHATQGRCKIKNDRSCIEDFNHILASQPMALTKVVLLERVAKSMSGIRPLTREGPAAEAEALRSFVRDIVEEAGLVGGPAMASAIVERARLVFAAEDDLKVSQAVEQLLGLMPNRAVRLGFLFDLIASPFGQQNESAVLGILGRLVQQLSSLSSLIPEGSTSEKTHAIVDALTEKMKSDALPEHMRALFSKTLDRLVSTKGAPEGEPLIFKMEDATVTKPKQIERREASSGEVLFEEGDKADVAYLVMEGTIEIFRKSGNGEEILASLGRGEIVGEMSLIDNQPRMASARVTQDTKLSVITREDLSTRLDKLGHDDRVLRRIIDVFVGRLRGQGRSHE